MQYAVAVAEARRSLPVEQMRIDACHLRRHVGTDTQRTAGDLIDQLEGAQLEILAGPGEERIEVFDQRRHYQFIAVCAEQVEHRTALTLNTRSFKRQRIGKVFWKQPVHLKTMIRMRPTIIEVSPTKRI